MPRALVAVLALAMVPCAPVTPATASGGGAFAFAGDVEIDSFGTGASWGSASLSITGSVSGSIVVGVPATATFTVFEDPTVCPVLGTADGTISGAVNESFTWTRVGVVLVMSMRGDLNGNGLGAIAFTSVGLNCGSSSVRAQVAGAVVDDEEEPEPPPIAPPDCMDQRDNDFDGQTDYPFDPGCDSPADLSES